MHEAHDHAHDPHSGCCGGLLSCPGCAAIGRPVGRDTVQRFVSAEDLASLGPGEIRFCSTPDCAIAYYGVGGGCLNKERLSVRLGFKELEAPRVLCHCFGYTREGLAAEYRTTGRIGAVMAVSERLRNGECRCEELNPSGTNCLAELRRALVEIQQLKRDRDPDDSGCGDDVDCSGCSGCG